MKPKIHEYGRVSIGRKFVGPWQWDGSDRPHMSRLRDAYDAALKVAAEAIGKREEIAKNPNLTKQGQAAEFRAWAHRSALGTIARAQKIVLPAARRDLEAQREKIRMDGPDKSDVAGALLRQEIRGYLRSLATAERTSIVLNDDLDPVVALAIIEAPAELSGVTKESREKLVNKALEALHPGELKAIREMEGAIETVQRAVKAAGGQIMEEIGMSPEEFTRWLEQAPASVGEPAKLKRYGSEVKVLRQNSDGEWIAADPTAEELETGVFVDEAA